MRNIGSVLIILLFASRFETATVSWGYIRWGNLLLFDQFFHQNAVAGEAIKDLNFSAKRSTITAIHVTDLTGAQNGGTVRIIHGGIGYNYVKLKLTSEINQALLLNVEIFGS